MKQRIRRFEPFQVAKMMGVLYAFVGLLLAPIFYLASTVAPGPKGFGTAFVIALPVIYGIAGFIFTALGAALYNLVAGWVGGIEVDLEPVSSSS